VDYYIGQAVAYQGQTLHIMEFVTIKSMVDGAVRKVAAAALYSESDSDFEPIEAPLRLLTEAAYCLS
jgi:hypothetical protein